MEVLTFIGGLICGGIAVGVLAGRSYDRGYKDHERENALDEYYRDLVEQKRK